MRKLKPALKFLFAILFVAAGFNHFFNPGFYLQMMPPYLPWHHLLVYLSGFFEIMLGVLLLIPKLTRMAAWGLLALLIAVFPANIQMAFNHDLYPEYSVAALWLRLPLQIVLIGWAYWHTVTKAQGQKRGGTAAAQQLI